MHTLKVRDRSADGVVVGERPERFRRGVIAACFMLARTVDVDTIC